MNKLLTRLTVVGLGSYYLEVEGAKQNTATHDVRVESPWGLFRSREEKNQCITNFQSTNQPGKILRPNK